MYNQDAFQLFNPIQRDLAAKAITGDGTRLPEIVCRQEVESLIALRSFNEQHLDSAYKYALLTRRSRLTMSTPTGTRKLSRRPVITSTRCLCPGLS
jgi:hypothetical protein